MQTRFLSVRYHNTNAPLEQDMQMQNDGRILDASFFFSYTVFKKRHDSLQNCNDQKRNGGFLGVKVWLYRKDAPFQKFFRMDVPVCYIEDGGTFSNSEDLLFLHKEDACPASVSRACCRNIEFERKKLNQCLLQPMVKNYDAWWLKYQMQRTDPFDTVVAGSSYPLFGLDMQQLPSWRNLSLASQDFYYAILLAKQLYARQPYQRIVLGHYYYSIFSDLSRAENPGELMRISNVYTNVLFGGDRCIRAIYAPRESSPASAPGILSVARLRYAAFA